MRETVERVADALEEALGIHGNPTREHFVEAARAAIEAMREPDRQMLNRGGYHCITGAGAVSSGDMAQAKAVWKAMIKEALEP